MNGLTIHTGDALAVLRTMPDESVHCIVTPPPYFGLRDYGTAKWEGGDPGCDHLKPAAHGYDPFKTSTLGPNNDGCSPSNSAHCDGTKRQQFPGICGKCGARRIDSQLGLEKSPEEYLSKMVEVFREARRVLRQEGTLWLNMGDSYAGSWGNYHPTGKGGQRSKDTERYDRRAYKSKDFLPPTANCAGLKPKDLCMMPARLAIALQSDGWWLRSEIVWHKPNPMPESVTDRPTKSHEMIYLLTKSARYFYDAEAIKEKSDASDASRKRIEYGRYDAGDGTAKRDGRTGKPDYLQVIGNDYGGGTRNARSVWTIATEPYPEAHFATFPRKLAERCILAGTSERGCCSAMIKKLKLRDDISDDDRAKVLIFLQKKGLA